MEKAVLENHAKYLERKKIFESFGYDVDREREFVLGKALPLRGDILEAGTGKGHFSIVLARAGYRFTTIDISEGEQKLAKLNLKYFGLDHYADFLVEDGESLSFKSARFGAVFSVNTLHHLPRPLKVAGELIRVLSPGGKIVLSDFTRDGFAMMDKIHNLEGRKHESNPGALADIETRLADGKFSLQKHRSAYQEVLVALSPPGPKGA